MELSRQRHCARLRAALLASSALIAAPAAAQDATWLAVPATADWNTPPNWNPAVVPTGTATFDASNKTSLTFSAVTTNIDTLQFNAGAPAYTFTLNQVIANQTLNINGTGIVNNSSFAPTLAISGINAPQISVLNFNNGSTAGNAIIDNSGGLVSFNNASTADTANITNNVFLQFINSSTAGNATITSSGNVGFGDSSTAGNANITIGVAGSGSLGFLASATAGDATITTNFNSGGSAATLFFQTSSGGNARFITNAGGGVDFSFLTTAGTTAGSIEGAGTYFLGSKNLTVGSNNLSTEVSGAIVDGGSINPSTGGSLTKVGAGTLLLSGTNGYSGGTTISGGTVQVTNADSVGSGAVTLDGGTFKVDSSVFSVGFLNDFKINAPGGTVDNNGASLELSGVISNGNASTGVLQLTDSTGGGTTLLSGVNTYTGGTKVIGTTVQVNNNSSVGTGLVTLEDARFMAADVLLGTSLNIANNFAINNAGSGGFFDANGWSMTISGNIADGNGPGQVTVQDSFGGGVVIFTGDKTYTGGTIICACGTLQLGTLSTPGSILGPVTNEGVLNVINSNTSLITTLTNDGGETNFYNGTNASAITIVNQFGGATVFRDTSSAANANITNSFGSAVVFLDSATAGNATITNNLGGSTEFGQPFGTDTPKAGTATITNNNGGITDFNAASSADHAKITTNNGGELDFWDTSTAGNATITTNSGGTTFFNDSSTAGASTITNSGTLAFFNSSSAGSASISTTSGSFATITFNDTSTAGSSNIALVDGTLTFNDFSTAANATIVNNSGGTTTFGVLGGTDTSNAGTSHITNNNSGTTNFLAHTSAMNATIANNSGGNTHFQDQSTAGNATIVNNSGGTTTFGVTLGTDTASAGNAVIINNSGGTTAFFAATTAGSATIINSFGGIVQFGDSGGANDTATAGSSTIDNSGVVSFNSKTTAATATITTHSGGNVLFFDTSSGGGARFITEAGGTVDISALTSPGTTAGSIEGAGSYILGAKNFAVGSNNLSTQVSGVISGTGGSLTKVGTGTLILSGTNTYTGGTTISGGTLQLGTGGTTGSVVGNVSNFSNLAFNRSDAVTFGGVISGSGVVVQKGPGTLTLTNANTYSGGTTVAGGTLSLQNNHAAGTGAITTTGSVIDYGNGIQIDNPIVLNSNTTQLQVLTGSATQTGVISETGGARPLEKIGAGSLILTATNTYTGPTTITAGTLQLGNGGTTGLIVGDVTDNGTLAFNRSNTLTFGGVISGGGAVQQIGTGTTILTGANTFTGGTTISGGTLQFGNGGATGSIVGNVIDNATLAFNRSDNVTFSNLISGSGVVVQKGPGTLTLTNANTYTGGTTISGGTLQLGAGGTTGSIVGDVVDNATLAFNRSNALTFGGMISGTGAVQQIGTGATILTGANTYTGGTAISAGTLQLGNGGTTGSIVGDVTDNGTLAFNRSNTLTLGGVISGSGALQQNGTGVTILTGANTYAGGTMISAGTLQLGNGGATGSVVGNIVDNGTLAINRSDNFVLANTISGSGAFQQNGSGITRMTGTNTYTGGTTISSGTLQLGAGGAGATTGSITGNVVDNGILAFGRSDAVTFGGVISGTGTVVQQNSGTTTLTGANTYSGGTILNNGILAVSSNANLGAAAGGLTFNGGTLRALADFNSARSVTLNAGGGTIGTNGFNVGWGGVISGVGGLTKNGNGALVLTADNTYTGGTTISAGQLRLGNGGTAGSILGDVIDNAAFSINRTDTYTFAGLISGTGSFNQIGTGTTVLVNDNTYAGGTTISAGTLQLGNGGTTGSFLGDVANNGTLAFNRSNALTFAGVISGTGAVQQNGTGSTNLTATNTYTGATTVNAGTLFVNGSIASSSSLTVNAGGTIGGSGALPKTTINGGTLSPGNSIGTISVGGSLTFVGAGNYIVEVSPAAADRTNVSGAPGTATLAGALSAVGTGGSYTIGTRYTVLNATGGVSGTFGNLAVSGDFGATKPHIEYDANNVFLVLDPNALSLVGLTPNERSVATSINTALLAGNKSAPFVALFGLTAAQLPGALDQLSGEVHPSTASVLLDESLYARSAILGRLRQASYGGDAQMASLSAGGPQAFANGEELSALAYAKSPIVTKAPPMVSQPSYDVVFWAQGFGAWGRFDTDGNAASVRRDLAGFFTGVDTRVGTNGRLGIAAGYTGSRNTLDGRGGSTVETGHIAGYGGWSFGGLNLRGGGDFAFHTIDASRTVFFPGFFDTDTARYNGSTAQIFGEAGYGFAFGKVAVEPFAGAAFVRLQTDAFNERGGAAALTVAANSFEVGYSTLGIRAATMIPLAADMMLVPRASAAWQHAFDTVTPTDTMAFQSAGVPFVIAGVPIARDSLLAEAGLDLAIGRNATIGISYVGQIANNVQDHAAKGKFSWKF